ncbi:SGNH/GDSL hydrolase family protein [Microbacterium sp. RG1]|uniref:SGNH/GDSL hydrolase family protein n=1 Tax=Microbacterium sp. RG1 TaxID=2489212 RepID=UPI00137598E3|nr:SGNH/GDSL hydrolase family protein [Microbacterium sp. RG1]
MANGDDALAAGMDIVRSTDDRRQGYDEDNKTRDYIARMREDLADVSTQTIVEDSPVAVGRNAKFTTLPAWWRALQRSLLNNGPARILCVGDSTTAGVYSDSFTTAPGTTNQGGPNSYPARLAARLTALGIPALYAMSVPGHAGNDDSRWNRGPFGYVSAGVGAGGNAGLELSGAGSCTYTPDVAANQFFVYFFGDTGTGTITAQATGGSAVAINTQRATPGIYRQLVTAGSVSAGNVLTITRTAGTSFVAGVEIADSTRPNIVRVLNAGVGGSQADHWANKAGNNTFGGRAFITAVQADLTLISLGINDIENGRTVAQIITDTDALIATARAAGGDAAVVSAFPHSAPSQVDALNAYHRTRTVPLIDLAHRYGNRMTEFGFMTTDGTHPNALGYADAAMLIASTITT